MRVRTRYLVVVLAWSIGGCAAGGDAVGSGDHFVQLPSAPPEVAPSPAATHARLIVVFDHAESAPPESWFFLRAVGGDDELVLDGRTDQGAQHQLPPGWYTITAYYRPCTNGCSALGEVADICAMRQPVFANAKYLFRVDFSIQICELELQPPLEPEY